jgi:hypothetical protein
MRFFFLEGNLILTPDGHADKPDGYADQSRLLNNLGNSFVRRYERSGDLTDIDRAISAHNRAGNLTPNGHVANLVV